MRGAVLLFLAVVSSAIAARDFPDQFESKNPFRKTPLWIFEREAVSSDGELRAAAVEPVEHRILYAEVEKATRRRASTSAAAANDGCAVTFGSPYDDAPNVSPPQSWSAVRARAKSGTVLRGTVRGIRAGLYGGIPFSVLQIDLAEQTRSVYLLYPEAKVTVNGATVCTNDPSYSGMPDIGNDIIFVAAGALDTGNEVYRVPAECIVQNAVVHLSSLLAFASTTSSQDSARSPPSYLLFAIRRLVNGVRISKEGRHEPVHGRLRRSITCRRARVGAGLFGATRRPQHECQYSGICLDNQGVADDNAVAAAASSWNSSCPSLGIPSFDATNSYCDITVTIVHQEGVSTNPSLSCGQFVPTTKLVRSADGRDDRSVAIRRLDVVHANRAAKRSKQRVVQHGLLDLVHERVVSRPQR